MILDIAIILYMVMAVLTAIMLWEPDKPLSSLMNSLIWPVLFVLVAIYALMQHFKRREN